MSKTEKQEFMLDILGFRIFNKYYSQKKNTNCKMSKTEKQEFMLATDMTGSGTPEEKLRWAFRMYDKDNSG